MLTAIYLLNTIGREPKSCARPIDVAWISARGNVGVPTGAKGK